MTKYAIVLDTETANSLEEPLCYDLGWAVVDLETKEVVKTESYAIADVFLDKELMTSAYYAEKIPDYWDEIDDHERRLVRFETAKRRLYKDCKEYGIREIYAHNARFDYRSCTLTQRYTTCSRIRYFFPRYITICDTLKMARKTFKTDPEYIAFCDENGYRTKNNQLRFTAEILYRFLSGKNDFEEAHRGLDDVMIEKEILFACRERGVMDGRLWED